MSSPAVLAVQIWAREISASGLTKGDVCLKEIDFDEANLHAEAHGAKA